MWNWFGLLLVAGLYFYPPTPFVPTEALIVGWGIGLLCAGMQHLNEDSLH